MLDLVKPREPDKVTLRDLKSCKLAYIFFDTFFNLEKYLEHEQRDPFTNTRVSSSVLVQDKCFTRWCNQNAYIRDSDLLEVPCHCEAMVQALMILCMDLTYLHIYLEHMIQKLQISWCQNKKS